MYHQNETSHPPPPHAPDRHWRCSAIAANLPGLLDRIEESARGMGMPADRCPWLRLIAEELLVNVFSYAYPEGVGEIEVEMTNLGADALRLGLTDQGIPFDPLEQEPCDVTAPREGRRIGGVGIHLVRQLASRLIYTRSEGSNRLWVDFPKRAPGT